MAGQKERDALERLLAGEIDRRLPELADLARRLRRIQPSHAASQQRGMQAMVSYLRTSGFDVLTVAPHVNLGFSATTEGSSRGGRLLLASALAHGPLAAAMTLGAAAALAALRLRWPGNVTALVLPSSWHVDNFSRAALPLDTFAAALSATVGETDADVAVPRFAAAWRLVFHNGVGTAGAGSGSAGTDAANAGNAQYALDRAVRAYEAARTVAAALPADCRLVAELHSRHAGLMGAGLAELWLRGVTLRPEGLAELARVVDELAAKHGGVQVALPTARAEQQLPPAGEAPAAFSVLTPAPRFWQRLGRAPVPSDGWNIIPNNLTPLLRHMPLCLPVIGVGERPGTPQFTLAAWGERGVRALRDGATLLAWQAAALLFQAASAQKAEADAL